MRIRCNYCGDYLEEGEGVVVGGENYHLKCAVDMLRNVKKKYISSLLKKKNVVGTGIGFLRDGEVGLLINVERKTDAEYLKGYDVVPKWVEDVKTDIVVTGKLVAPRPITSISKSSIDRKKPVRPAPGGVSIGHYNITAGTLGFLVDVDNERYIISNNHVLANENDAEIGDEIYQPGPYDGGTSEDTIAYLTDFIPIKFDEENYVDAAIASPVSPNDVTFDILGLGIPRGFSTPFLGERVVKSGRTTGVTYGEISQIHGTFRIEYDAGEVIFEDQIMITPGDFSDGGDSGSAILDSKTHKIVALLFAGSEYDTISTPIDTVLHSFWK